MNKSISRTMKSMLMATVAVTGVALAPKAYAQSADEKVTVTGTRIKQPNNTAATATSTISTRAIELAAEPNVVDVLRDYPQVAPATLSSVNSNFLTSGNGVNTLDLRNLSDDRTLVLVNGRRFISGVSGSNAVDFNAIPTDMIERIDIVSGGSSAVYGSDAVAGVVNIILKRNYEGVTATIQGATNPEYPTNDTFRASGTAGANFDGKRGNAIVNVTFERVGPAVAADRDTTAQDCASVPASIFLTTCGARSSYALGGNYRLSDPAGAGESGFRLNGNGTIQPFVTADGFSRNPLRLHMVPYDKRGFSGALNYDVLPEHTVFAELNWSRTSSKSDLEPFPLDSADVYGDTVQVGAATNTRLGIAPNNPFTPRSLLDQMCVNYGIGANLAACQAIARPALVTSLMATPDAATGFRHRLAEIGNRGNDYTSQTARSVIGLEGKLGSWDYELSHNFGVLTVVQQGRGQINTERLRQSLDVTDLNVDGDNNPNTNPQDVVCNDGGAVAAGCVAVNFFAPTGTFNSFTPAQFQWLNAPSSRQIEQTQEIVSFNATGEIIDIWAGAVEGVVGAEYRRETSSEIPDALTQSGGNGGNQEPPIIGDFDVWEAFTEVKVPLLKDLPGIKSLDVGGAARWSDYSTVGATFAYSANANWIVTDGIRIRGQIATAVRAPNIGELFAGRSETFAVVSDPCNNLRTALGGGALPGGPTNPVVIANCLANPAILARANTPTGFVLTLSEQQGTGGFSGGNINLSAEKADTSQFGIVITPAFWGDWLGNLTVSADYFTVEVNDAIEAVSRNDTLTACYTTPGLASPFCNQAPGNTVGFIRDINGALSEVNTALANSQRIVTDGFDVQASYQFAVGSLTGTDSDWGDLALNATLTHLNTYNTVVLPETTLEQTTQRAGHVGFAENKLFVNAIYSISDLTLSWSSQYLSDADEYAARGIIPAQWFHDVAGSYQVFEHVEVFGGIRNVGDNYVFVSQGTNGTSSSVPTGWTTFPDVYDGLGRRYYGGVRVKF